MITKIKLHNGSHLQAGIARPQLEKAITQSIPVLLAANTLFQKIGNKAIVIDTRSGKFIATIFFNEVLQ